MFDKNVTPFDTQTPVGMLDENVTPFDTQTPVEMLDKNVTPFDTQTPVEMLDENVFPFHSRRTRGVKSYGRGTTMLEKKKSPYAKALHPVPVQKR